MSKYHEIRMALGLSRIPDPLRGDFAEIERLRGEIERLREGEVVEERIQLRAEIERLQAEQRCLFERNVALTRKISDTAAFLDRLAAALDRQTMIGLADDCRAEARKLRGET